MTLDSLGPWRDAALAFLLSFAWAAVWRLLKRPDLGALGAGLGGAVGVIMAIGPTFGSPRQLPERLPSLVGAGAALGFVLLLLGGTRRPVLTWCVTSLVVLAGAWWLSGAAVTPADLGRASRILLGLAILLGALALALRGPWHSAYAASLLLGGLWLAAPLGPWPILAAVLLAATLGAVVGGAEWPVAARLPVALGLGGVVAGAVMARGSALDWAVAGGPILAVCALPLFESQFPGRVARPVTWIVAAALALLFTWMHSRGP